ncbi:L,D-transpeptidase family protein [Nonomuraea fuscirosea]|uniref:L,D-transpeptidase family protein n=1 Tax=Nonomuraea fuscirosea TaxID=1291556 RepID=UPI0033E08BE3
MDPGRPGAGRADTGRPGADRADARRSKNRWADAGRPGSRWVERDRPGTGRAGASRSDTRWSDARWTDTRRADTRRADTTRAGGTQTSTTPTGTTRTGTGRTDAGQAGSASTGAVAGALLRPGDRGEAVRLLQRRLHAGHYYYGKINGVYDEQTKFAVWALQKNRRMAPKGEVGRQVWNALDKPARRRPLVPNGGPDRVEINLRDQFLTVYRDRKPVLFSHISTGAEVRYCEGGRCGTAITPVGDFRVQTRAPGWTTGRLGSMFNSLYFTGGIAMHGSTKVPLRPASHGCVRLPIETSKRLYEMVKVGEPVYVRGKIM